MIDTVIFDLDGVLVKTKDIHYECLNKAIEEISKDYSISRSEHFSIFDGLSTKRKLELLSELKGLPESKHDLIWERKQILTDINFSEIKEDPSLVDAIYFLKESNIKLACCSNSILKTINSALKSLNIIDCFDIILSNEDIFQPKPHPEIYWRAMIELKSSPCSTVIFEDSPNGLKSALTSGANVVRIRDPKEITKYFLMKNLNQVRSMKKEKWLDEKMNVLIPMAGAGSRFEKAGYTFPKPLIDVNGKPMIQVVVDNLSIEANYIFVVQSSHRKKYNLDDVLSLISPNCKIVEVDDVTEGAACTTLLAEKYIDNDNPLVIANSDQFVEWSSSEFFYKMQEQDVDASILTFRSVSPKWSFAKLGNDGLVSEVAEKRPISNIATVGIYAWKKGSDYVKYAKEMINSGDRFNNEFYVCPVFNHAIQDGKKVSIYDIKKMWGLGTPEDLEYFLKENQF